MFTGLIEEIGKVSKIDSIPGGKKLTISASKILENTKVDDSICIDGVCLTVTEIKSDLFSVDAVGATLTKTTLADARINQQVNLERALRLSDRLGRHLVQGHVNGVGHVSNILKMGDNYRLEIVIPNNLKKYVIAEGSISVNGISLTVADISDTKIGISIIPHTWNNTNLRNIKNGDAVNIETDLIAKYVEKLMGIDEGSDEKFTDEWFKKLGY